LVFGGAYGGYRYFCDDVGLCQPDKITIATFNIQDFGQSEIYMPYVMGNLTLIARNFDVIAIQEISNKDQTVMPHYKDLLNGMEGPDYNFTIGPRLGRNPPWGLEQYAYLFNTETIELVGSGITYPEPAGTDPFPREPFIASFKTIGGNFDFVLINIHTKPDDATNEISHLPNVIEFARQSFPEEEDFILLGDLNADCDTFDEENVSYELRAADFIWLTNNSLDTMIRTSTDCAYDRIITTQGASEDYAGEVGVFRFDEVFGIPFDKALKISDHYPVYAVFWINRDSEDVTTTTTTTSQSISINITAIYDPPGPEPDNEVITLKNMGSVPVSIGGWELTDNEGSYTIPPDITLEPAQEWSVQGSTYNPSGSSAGLYLSNSHDEVILKNAAGAVIEEFSW
jgi:endonuclease/exonuclease/phosphatase family metal-dependent hydrolase